MFGKANRKEQSAIIHLMLLELKLGEEYYQRWRLNKLNHLLDNIRLLITRIEDHSYNIDDYQDLQDLRSQIKSWDGNHFLIYLVCRICVFLNFEKEVGS